jgi:hypothetical protein
MGQQQTQTAQQWNAQVALMMLRGTLREIT